MRLECNACAGGDHAECGQRGQMAKVVCQCDCPTAVQARKMLRVEPPATIPMYAMLDLYMALGFDSANFDGEYDQRGYAGMWSWLLERVRSDRYGLKAIEREETKAAASLGVARSHPALIEAALRETRNAKITGMSVTVDADTAYYTFTVEGR